MIFSLLISRLRVHSFRLLSNKRKHLILQEIRRNSTVRRENGTRAQLPQLNAQAHGYKHSGGSAAQRRNRKFIWGVSPIYPQWRHCGWCHRVRQRMVSPYFSPHKFFSYRPLKSDDVFSYRLETPTLTAFQRRFSSVHL